jgi:hypothetical protein
MQQRRYRPGDVLDDYCPRERRITDHAIVAMIDDHIKQTRCVVCDAEHEYKDGKVPAQRRKKPQAALFSQVLEGLTGKDAPGRVAQAQVEEPDELLASEADAVDSDVDETRPIAPAPDADEPMPLTGGAETRHADLDVEPEITDDEDTPASDDAPRALFG